MLELNLESVCELQLAVVFDLIWQDMESEGECDGFEGVEYHRVRRDFLERYSLHRLRWFIGLCANGPSGKNVAQQPVAGDMVVPICARPDPSGSSS